MNNKLLLLGPMANKKNPHRVSGTIVLFGELWKHLDNSGIEFEIIDTNKLNYRNNFIAFCYIIIKIVIKIKNYDHISIHSSRDFIFIAPVIIVLSKILKKKTSLRKFGGNLKDFYENSRGINKFILNNILINIDYLFVETKYLYDYFVSINKNTNWLPNSRGRVLTEFKPRKFRKKFVFISHVKRSKGIDEILSSSKKLDADYLIHIYGPIMKGDYNQEDFNEYKDVYRGPLASEDVVETLNRYDVLLLPTCRISKEGYPGIIIEAYSVGIPVIATNLTSIKEIVTDGVEGILVNPRDSRQLLDAIKSIDEVNYKDLSRNAFLAFDKFDSEIITQNYLETIFNGSGND